MLIRPGRRPSPTRHLFRLVAGLVTVIVVIRAASQPGLYEPLFGDVVMQRVRLDTPTETTAESEDERAPDSEASELERESELNYASVPSLVEGISDASVWLRSDREPLAKLLRIWETPSDAERLARASDDPTQNTVSVLSMLQQPTTYRGTTVGVDGRVASIQRVEGPQGSYWQMWLRPSDRTPRPIVLIAPSVPTELQALANPQRNSPEQETEFTPTKNPRIQARGTFVKRLSYQSGIGADMAPVVVGRLVAFEGPNTGKDQQDNPTTSPLTSMRWVGLILAAILGVFAAVWAMRNAAKDSEKLRKARRRAEENQTFEPPAGWMDKMVWIGWLFFAALGSHALAQPIENQPDEDQTSLNSIIDVQPETPARFIDKIPGFNQERLENAFPVTGDGAELCKLLYRLSRSTTPLNLPNIEDDPAVGDAVAIEGIVSNANRVKVPEELAEFLDSSTFQWITLASNISVFVMGTSVDAMPGDQLRANGIRLPNNANGSSAIAAIQIQTTPKLIKDHDHRWLANHGFAISDLQSLRDLNGKTLRDRDADPFFSILSLSNQTDTPETLPPPSPQTVTAFELLREPESWTGKRVKLDAEVVRIQRVAIESIRRQQEIGDDHYYQIDAMTSLGDNRVVKLNLGEKKASNDAAQEEPESDVDDEVQFNDRYPLSIVAKSLPPFIESSLETTDPGGMLRVRLPVQIEGWFYRLWRYDSALSDRYQSAKQTSPLIMASLWKDQRIRSSDPLGVRWIGYLAAMGVLSSMTGVVIWTTLNRRADRSSGRV
ncbi:MAG: hypothetical protein AAF664_19805 [Planctomycetota bacterium]